jgi:hypothetical protein
MIWHIFKKDWRLLWLFAVCIGALHFVLNADRLSLGRFYQARFALTSLDASSFLPGRRLFLANSLPFISLLGSALMIIAIVQQDAIPGLRQDWLIRPIRRRDLLLSKMVAVLVMVQAPIFFADLGEALATGFSLRQSAGAAFGRSVVLLFAFSLPLLGFASLTKNYMEAIAAGVALTLGVSIMLTLTSRSLDGPTGVAAVGWIDFAVRDGILVVGTAVLLGMQYFRRTTILSRWLMAGIVVLYMLVPPVPWQSAFALEQRLSPNPGAGNPIAINFVPDRSAIADRAVGPGNSRAFGNVFVLLPIRATGLPEPSILLGDASFARLITPDGQVHNIGGQNGFGIWKEQRGEGEAAITYGIRVRPELYRSIADQPVRVEIDYSLTLMGLRESHTRPASGGDVRSAGMGWCGTKVDSDGLQILYGCIHVGNPDWCTSVVLEDQAVEAHNRRVSTCRPNYSPFRSDFQGDVLGRIALSMPFADPSIGDPTLVTPAMLGQATVTARFYEVRDHFVRQLVIPQIRLRDWATE